MPGRLKVRIVAGRHLPVMDRASELTDAFVEVKFGATTYKTEVYSKSLNPLWNSPWFKFEVDDEHLQDELLQVRVLDHDTYSSHDAIGKVNIDIDPLLDPESRNDLYGWFPIYDTMHGIRGEILLKVKLELFADSNQFRQSSCGFKFICATKVPECYKVTAIHGFVHELLVREDPEYKWIDKLRTPRASNEARQRLFSKMSGELQRHIGTKVESIGGNAVVGFHHSFDIEGDSGIVVRGIGTAVTIESVANASKRHSKVSPKFFEAQESALHEPNEDLSFLGDSSLLHHSLHEETFHDMKGLLFHKTSTQGISAGVLKDFPFYTLHSYPHGFVTRISTMVTSHSVKLLEKVYNTAESETRDGWWSELRQEIKSNCHVLGCNSVIGYKEKTTICDEVVVLSAQGSAAVVDTSLLSQSVQLNADSRRSSRDALVPPYGSGTLKTENKKETDADLFRVRFRIGDQSYPMNFQPSPLNPDLYVPDILFAAVEVPDGVRTVGKAAFIQARYCRSKKKGQGDSNAVNVSEILPFIEYELHKQLCKKLKLRCMNAVFGFESNITLGENLVVGIATGTAVLLEALPAPSTLSESVNKATTSSTHSNIEQLCAEFASKCKETYEIILKPIGINETNGQKKSPTSSIGSLDLSLDGKESLAIAVEDADDESELLSYLSDNLPPPGCFLSTLDMCPGIEKCHHLLQSFSLVRRVRYSDDADDVELNAGLRTSCEQALAGVWFRLRMKADVCHVCSLKFHIVLPDDDELQIWMSGAAIMSEPHEHKFEPMKISRQSSIETSQASSSRHRISSGHDSENQVFHNRSLRSNDLKPFDSPLLRMARTASRKFMRSSSVGGRFRRESGSGRVRHNSEGAAPWNLPEVLNEEVTAPAEPVHIVPMACVPGQCIVKHVGILNMFIIRETTSVRGSDEEVAIAEPPHGTGSCWFVTRSLAETNALIRAHVVAVGGNALTSCRSSYRMLSESLTKNEAQTLLHVTGDVVLVRGL